ncbi:MULTISPECIES: PilW family protein [unclassified Microbulbifer]|uniref:PilW family protein n=1 Tax=unclassified Microbulbifer TaxID=2619833 RepID=UPI0027E52FEE|nr:MULTISPECIES: PilW family protein [unclassified Microbulbifer]
MRKQRGVSLVELMVAITIGLILMTGVVQLFLSSRATFTTQQAISRVQETGRLAMEFLGQDIRMAGYMGCMSRNLNYESALKPTTSPAFDFGAAIEGIDDYPDAQQTGYPDALEGTDMVVVRSANGSGVGVISNNNGAQLNVDYTGKVADACRDSGGGTSDMLSGLCEEDILVISNCARAMVFQATELQETAGGGGTTASVNVVHAQNTDNPGNDFSSWGGSSGAMVRFGPESEVIKMTTTFYYVANNGADRPSLYQKVGNAPEEELLTGVEDMQIFYGLDSNDDGVPNNYVDADNVSDWELVLSARVELLVQSSEDNVLAESQSYTFPTGAASTPATDRRLRQVFVNTIGIRSRLP